MIHGTMLLALAALTLGRESLGPELKERATFRVIDSRIGSVALSPDGKKMATCTRILRTGEVTLWDVSSGKAITTFTLPNEHPYAVCFSPDGKRLAALLSLKVMVWDSTAHKLVATLKTNSFSSGTLAFSPDGKKLGLTNSRETQLWDVTAGKKLSSFQRPLEPYAMAFQPDLRTLASENAQEIDLWDVETGKRRAVLSEHRGRVRYLAYSSDGKTLVAASRLERGRMNHVGDVRLWDVATGKTQTVFQEGIASVSRVCLSPDGKTLALLNWRESFRDQDADLVIVDVTTGKQRVLPFTPGNAFAFLTFTTNGRLFLIDSPDDRTIKLWEFSLAKLAPPDKNARMHPESRPSTRKHLTGSVVGYTFKSAQ